ncbi:MAG TPA: hypothetical protein VMZ27_00485 [Candidatus Saccharimonadales bacterium]|nr:hypothetical protein [Candidatus Saccharimonadales bacterium]
MIEPILQSQLEPIAQRHRRSRFWRELTLGWGLLTPILLAGIMLSWGSTFIGLFSVAALGVLIFVSNRNHAWNPDYREIARRIEHQHPDLHALLITAVEQRPSDNVTKLNFLQERVVREASAEIRKLPWLDQVTVRQIRQWQVGTVALLALWIAGLFFVRSPEARSAALLAEKNQKVTVTPGDANLEKGSTFVVLARFNAALPKEAVLVIRPPSGTHSQKVLLSKNLGDPVFGGSIPEVSTNFTYLVEYDGKQTEEFKIRVYEHPRMDHADAKINYPEYTKLAPKLIPETKRISAVEGSKLDFTLKLNKPVASARLIGKDKSVVPLSVDTNNPVAKLEQFTLMTNGVYNLELVDTEGRTNKIPAQFAFDALKNRPPELKVITPRGDQRVSPLEEVSFQGEAWDDFGLGAYGLTYIIGGDKSKSITLGDGSPAGEKRPFQKLLPLEELSAQPDQLISWYLWAEDIGPDGKVRRTSTDMYFVEVRRFEEIYRQGNTMEGQAQQQQQQQGGQANEAVKLAELQKQIINATWKIQRRETGQKPTDAYGKDLPVVLESQEKAVEQAEAMKEKAADPKSKASLEAVQAAMEKAAKHLGEATNSPGPLPSALASEQAAYQALLKLAGNEFMVTQNKSKGESQSSQANQRNQAQLSQLDLKKEDNRYETQKQASSPQQTEQQKEQLGILNKLKELAQRQQDLNDRMKELQNALQEAKTDAEKEEIRRRLKRLREEEQEMLASMDELQQRMQQPQNQSQTADAQKQLEQTRSEVQKASQALDKESPSQALASGTRAQRDLQQMRDDLRKKSSTQFSEEMRQMRSQARDLAQNQNDISKQMEAAREKDKKSLRESDATQQLAKQLQQQKDSLTNLLENMRGVSERSEGSEPLLSKQLYDSFRKANQENVEEKLKVSEELLNRNMPKEAGQVEQLARQHIDELKAGVEKAADSVLGDDVEALRQAKNELDALAKELEKELAQNGNGQKQEGQQGQQGQHGQKGTPGKSGQPQEASAEKGESGGQQRQPNGQGGKQEPQLVQANSKQDQPPGQGQGNPSQAQPPSEQKNGQGKQPGQKQGDQPGQGQTPGENQKPQDSQQQPGEKQDQQASQQQGGQQGQQKGQAGKQGDGQQGQPQQNQPGQQQGKGEMASNQKNQQPTQGQKGQGGKGQNNQKSDQQAQNPGKGEQPNPNPAEAKNDAAQDPNARAGNTQTARNKKFRFDVTQQEGGLENGNVGPQGPITGEDYVNWSERLGNVEEMVDVPQLRTEISRIRERARAARSEFKKQKEKPNWDVVRSQISGPLLEVRDRVAEELARRESKDALVPIDRDPVPAKFTELVKRYYEKLGSEK